MSECWALAYAKGHMNSTFQPLIGVSCGQYAEGTRHAYLHNGASIRYSLGLREVGAVPMLLPLLSDMVDAYAQRIDGLLLTGGADIHPRHYGQEPRHGLGEVDEDRDQFDLALYQAVRRAGKPIFGVCRGMQLINIAEGGTLHQHLPDVAGVWADHGQVAPQPALGHSVTLTEGSRLAAELGRQSQVNSYHHQALDKVAPSLSVVATAPDGVIEAVEGEGLLAVQWHPEMIWQRHPHALGAFRAFRQMLK